MSAIYPVEAEGGRGVQPVTHPTPPCHGVPEPRRDPEDVGVTPSSTLAGGSGYCPLSCPFVPLPSNVVHLGCILPLGHVSHLLLIHSPFGKPFLKISRIPLPTLPATPSFVIGTAGPKPIAPSAHLVWSATALVPPSHHSPVVAGKLSNLDIIQSYSGST